MAGIPLQCPLVTEWPDVQANMETIAVDGLAASAFLADRTAALADLGIARGVASIIAGSTSGSISGTLTFPTAFAAAPTSVLITPEGGAPLTATVQSITATGCTVWLGFPGGSFTSGQSYSFCWLAIL